ncbi:uncharacterized protein F5891DRAFT_1195800 [Suillus fuscotomentosus]|uniref:Uncharacterized protein n=1 Tax=Suillus fuscotomentosus TaxID=1912939 RepID=A0AAD4DTX5_9AGAM|nr:uncharacterized protein F5891DRAFT_1195800 [Suillus fuscotomentosus]KAG1893885.1 hypothetical protein F5891DRAFT_1195800 [Suillus fuscotomentosus]
MAPKRKRQASSQMDDARKSTSTLAVNSILQELLGNSAGSSTAYQKANSEANQGLKSASQSHSRPKAQMVSKSKPARLPNFHFKAGEIIFIPCGTKQSKKTSHSYIPLLTPVLRNPQAPTLVEVQTLEVMRLAITDYVDGIIISKNWSFELFDLELRKFFPRLFLYLDALPKLTNLDYEEDQDEIFQYLPQYYLCVKEKRRIVIPPGIQFPDGSSVARNARMNSRGGFRENVVILVTRQSIPLSVLQGWAKSKGKEKATLSSSSAYHGRTESESISSDSEDSSTSSESSLSQPPRKTKSHRVSTETDDEIMPASDSETISESATIVDLTASDDEYTGDFFGSFSLDNHDVVAEPEAPVEADLTPLEPVSSSPLQASVSFVIDPSLDNPPTLQASGSFVLDTSIDNPWEGNRLFNF